MQNNLIRRPQPQNHKQSLSEEPQPRTALIVQAVLGVLAGFLLDPILERQSFYLLVKLRVITLYDSFDELYTHEGIQRATIWCVFILVGMCLLALRRRARLSRFATVALGVHCLVGGLYSFIATYLVNFWV